MCQMNKDIKKKDHTYNIQLSATNKSLNKCCNSGSCVSCNRYSLGYIPLNTIHPSSQYKKNYFLTPSLSQHQSKQFTCYL